MNDVPQSVMVLSAHSGDFVWRAGGAIALASSLGATVEIVCLTFGERGESQGLWARPDMSMDVVKATRRDEAAEAASILGAEIDFLDLGDYPLEVGRPDLDTIVDRLRRARPDVLLTHVANDPYNQDHNVAHTTLLKARMVAQAQGHQTDHPPIGAPQVLMFEPHQPEMCEFRPNLLLDISAVMDVKRKAMECMSAQAHLIAYYSDLAVRRGVQAVRNGGARTIKYAEAHQRIYPVVERTLL